MDVPNVGLLVAFTGGLLSFLSPCVLPLVPSYVTFITGLSLDDVQAQRRTALIHGLFFVLGFSIIFVLLGAGATLLGQLLRFYSGWISRIGGVVIIIFGLYLMGIINISFLSEERRMHFSNKPVGYFGTTLVGVAFGAGWTPCIGTILAPILVLAGSEESLSRGITLLVAYSLGLAVPFLLAALAVDRFLAFFKRLRKQVYMLQRVAGAIMVALGLLMVSGRFTVIAAYLTRFTPDALLDRI